MAVLFHRLDSETFSAKLEEEIRSPWKRRVRQRTGLQYVSHTFGERFDARIDENIGLDLHTKLSALKVSQSVTSLVSRRGKKNKLLFTCSGTIIGCKPEEKGLFTHTILTSANLLISRAASSSENAPPLAPEPGIKVYVYLSCGESFEGEIFRFNFHYNIAIIKFKSSKRFPTAILKHIDGSIPLTAKAELLDSTSFGLRPHVVGSNLFNLCPGDKVIALGRHYLSHDLMVAPGAFRSVLGDPLSIAMEKSLESISMTACTLLSYQLILLLGAWIAWRIMVLWNFAGQCWRINGGNCDETASW